MFSSEKLYPVYTFWSQFSRILILSTTKEVKNNLHCFSINKPETAKHFWKHVSNANLSNDFFFIPPGLQPSPGLSPFGEIFFVTIQIHAKFRKNRESCLREGVLFLNRFYSCRIFFLHVTFLYSKIKSVVCNSSEPNGENFASSLQE